MFSIGIFEKRFLEKIDNLEPSFRALSICNPLGLEPRGSGLKAYKK